MLAVAISSKQKASDYTYRHVLPDYPSLHPTPLLSIHPRWSVMHRYICANSLQAAENSYTNCIFLFLFPPFIPPQTLPTRFLASSIIDMSLLSIFFSSHPPHHRKTANNAFDEFIFKQAQSHSSNQETGTMKNLRPLKRS